MSLQVRLITLSPDADTMARRQAEDERMEPEIYLSLVVELAVRERQALAERFAAALAKVNDG